MYISVTHLIGCFSIIRINNFPFAAISSDELRERIKKRIAELRSSRGGTAKEGGRRKKGGNKVNREDRNIHQGNDKVIVDFD